MLHLPVDNQPHSPNDLIKPDLVNAPVIRKSKWHRIVYSELWTRPWFSWLFVYAFVLFVFAFNRRISLTALVTMYASATDVTTSVVLGALSLGLLEDFVCATYFVSVLWLFDILKLETLERFDTPGMVKFACTIATFATSWLLFIAMMIPFWVDLLLVRMRGMRFTFDLVSMAIEEKDNLNAVPISSEEIEDGFFNAAVLIIVATIFASVRTFAPGTDLTSWNPFQSQTQYEKIAGTGQVNSVDPPLTPKHSTLIPSKRKMSYVFVQVDEPTATSEDGDRNPASSQNTVTNSYFKQGVAIFIALVLAPLAVMVISSAVSPLIAFAALNTTLNEMFGRSFEPHLPSMSYSLPWPEKFIHTETEEYTLFDSNSLYRRTTGFRGDAAFDVDVSSNDPPNVLLIVVESFRFHDSRYLVREDDPSNFFKGTNITITPNFDRWAKRGVAFRNFWSSWRTSRSVESLLFGQIPLDSTTKSGMTGGRNETKLSGLPQLFTAKGYETFFTTGCLTDYDGWDLFLPTHGFDTVWSRDEMKKLAESDLGIKPEDWDGDEHRALNWGLHDDLSFQLLGDLMVNKTREQEDRVANNEAKKPLFLTHYTISSHMDFKQRPKWYEESEKPDFSALYDGEQYADNIKNYLEIRYFTDMQLGKFMDRMDEKGILNDSIVVIVGDHGQGPEFGNDVPEDRDVSATRVAGTIIAEGRLGDSTGLVIDDATEHYDILNTLADMTGLPEGGFIQDGVGRSLKRKATFGERIVYSNNPTRKMSIVRGHQRLRYDRLTDSVLLHDADTDTDMHNDLFPGLPAKEQAEWLRWRDEGRQINEYYTERWEEECLLTSDCTQSGSVEQ